MNPYIAAATIGILAFIAGSHPRLAGVRYSDYPTAAHGYFSPDKKEFNLGGGWDYSKGYDVGYDFSDKKDGCPKPGQVYDGFNGSGQIYDGYDGYFGNGPAK